MAAAAAATAAALPDLPALVLEHIAWLLVAGVAHPLHASPPATYAMAHGLTQCAAGCLAADGCLATYAVLGRRLRAFARLSHGTLHAARAVFRDLVTLTPLLFVRPLRGATTYIVCAPRVVVRYIHQHPAGPRRLRNALLEIGGSEHVALPAISAPLAVVGSLVAAVARAPHLTRLRLLVGKNFTPSVLDQILAPAAARAMPHLIDLVLATYGQVSSAMVQVALDVIEVMVVRHKLQRLEFRMPDAVLVDAQDQITRILATPVLFTSVKSVCLTLPFLDPLWVRTMARDYDVLQSLHVRCAHWLHRQPVSSQWVGAWGRCPIESLTVHEPLTFGSHWDSPVCLLDRFPKLQRFELVFTRGDLVFTTPFFLDTLPPTLALIQSGPATRETPFELSAVPVMQGPKLRRLELHGVFFAEAFFQVHQLFGHFPNLSELEVGGSRRSLSDAQRLLCLYPTVERLTMTVSPDEAAGLGSSDPHEPYWFQRIWADHAALQHLRLQILAVHCTAPPAPPLVRAIQAWLVTAPLESHQHHVIRRRMQLLDESIELDAVLRPFEDEGLGWILELSRI